MGEMIEWYTKAAELGDAEAQCNLGVFYALGIGAKQDWQKAVSWFAKAAEHGHAAAQYHLGNCYYFGEGVEQDYQRAV